jgi:hypothetical protein
MMLLQWLAERLAPRSPDREIELPDDPLLTN